MAAKRDWSTGEDDHLNAHVKEEFSKFWCRRGGEKQFIQT